MLIIRLKGSNQIYYSRQAVVRFRSPLAMPKPRKSRSHRSEVAANLTGPGSSASGAGPSQMSANSMTINYTAMPTETPTDAVPQREEGNKRKINWWRKKKRSDFPFNFYIVIFGDKTARLERKFNSLTPFSKSRHVCNLDIICILIFSNSSVKLMFLRVYIKI